MSSRVRLLVLVARVALGLVFVIAATTKAVDVAGFTRALWTDYRLPAPMVSLAVLAPACEMAVGVALLCGVGVRFAARAAAAILVVFSAAIASGMLFGDLVDCGCLGPGTGAGPWPALVRNVALVALAVVLGWRFVPPPATYPRAGVWATAVCTCFVALLTGITTSTPLVDRTAAPLDASFPVERLPASEHGVAHGRWVVFAFAAGCDECWNATAQIETLVRREGVHVLGVTASDDEELASYRQAVAPSFPIVQIDHRLFSALQRRLPTTWLLEDGVVVLKREGGAFTWSTLARRLQPTRAEGDGPQPD